MKFFRKTLSLIAVSVVAMYALAVSPVSKVLQEVNSGMSNKSSATFSHAPEGSTTMQISVRTNGPGTTTLSPGEILTNQNVAIVSAPQSNASTNVVLYGTLIYSSKMNPGLYQIPTSTGGLFELMTSEGKPAKNGASVFDGKMMYGIEYPTGEIMMRTLNINDWSLASEVPVSREIFSISAVYDPTTDAVYGCHLYDGDTETGLFIDHYPEGKITMLGDLKRTILFALAVDATGQLYGIDSKGILYKLDKTNGALTEVGNTGVVSQYKTSGVIDPSTGIFYYGKSTDAGGWLYAINTKTAEASLVATFPSDEEIGGMFIMPTPYNDNAPGAVTDLKLNFENGNSNGKITFKAPETNGDGNIGRGSINYTVRANGKTIANGTTEYGQEINIDTSLAGGTFYSISAFASNSVGEGPRARATQFIGKDTPTVPNVRASFLDDEKAIFLQWDAITTGGSNGYINPDEITYTITRVQDNVVLSENQKETYYKDTSYGNGSKFQYKVTASYSGKISEPGVSNIIDMTVKYPPYLETFETKDPFTNDYTFIGSDKGDNKWTYNKSKQVVRAYYDFDYPKDEWLITPAIMLEAGKKYKFSFVTYTGSNSYKEHLEVFMGNDCSKEGMKTLLVNKTWSNKDPETVEAIITPEETGKYYFGFHACSDADCHYIYLDDIAVSAPTGENVPMAPSDMTVTPGDDCAKSATVSFTAPSLSIKGNNLESLEKIEIYRETALVHTIEKPVPGHKYEHLDNVPLSTTYTYAVYAYNEDGMGDPIKASAYVGIKPPAAPSAVTLEETSTPGIVTVSWTPSTTYFDGSPIHPENVQYALRKNKTVIIQGLTDPSYTFKAIEPDAQDFLQFEIVAVTEGGTAATGTFSNVLLCGSAQSAPYKESFKNGAVSSPISTISVTGEGSWKICTDKTFTQINAQDGDNGFLGFVAASANSSSALLTGKYNLKGISGSALTFYTLPTGDISKNLNNITVSVDDGNGWKDIKKIVMNTLFDQQKWNKVIVPLSQYDDKMIQLKITCTNPSYVYTYIDNIVLKGIDQHNLTPMVVNAPYLVNPNEEYDVTVYVSNSGITTTGKYNISLMRNDKIVGTQEGDALVCGSIARFDFKQSLDLTAERENIYSAVVDYDKNPSTVINKTDDVMTTLMMPLTPTITDLTGTVKGNNVNLEWGEPDVSQAIPATITEDFESYPAWSHGPSIGEWENIDGDGSVIGGPSQYSFPNIPKIGQGALAYFVIDNTWDKIKSSSSYTSHSGNKFISNMYCYDNKQNDDWLISPELYGGHQIVSIWARSFDERYPEAIEVLYSTTGRDRADFKHAISVDPLPDSWTEIKAVMPTGTKYFALRAVSFDAFMMFADDISYIPNGSSENITATGYNVYRDNVKITDEPIAERSYVDKIYDSQEHNYFVTAIYEGKGESPASNIVALSKSSSVDNVYNSTLKVKTQGLRIIISGATGPLNITDTTGRVIYSSTGSEVASVYVVQPGIYIVKDNQTVCKVVVR